jgi:hypothetical protein
MEKGATKVLRKKVVALLETELEIAKVLYHPAQQAKVLNQLETQWPRNAEQNEVFHEIMAKVRFIIMLCE